MTLAWYKDKIGCLVLFLISLILFTRAVDIHGLEYRDDEIFYVESTQEMLRNHDYLSPTYFGQNRFQKPILFYWFILASYKFFGINWFAARVVSALFGALTVSLTWLLARDFFGRKIASLAAVILMTVPMFLRHAKNAVPDMSLNFFIVLSMFCAAKIILILDREDIGREEKRTIELSSIFFFISLGLGFMVKGLAAVSVPLLTVLIYAVVHKDSRLIDSLKFVRGALIAAAIIAPWFLFMVYQHGSQYLNHMIVTETKDRIVGLDPVTAHGWIAMFFRHIGYYLYVILSNFAPWSVFAFVGIPSILRFNRLWLERHIRMVHFLLIWLLTVFAVFSIMSFRISHYMLVLTTPFAIMVSLFFLEKLDRNILLGRILFRFQKFMSLFVFAVCMVAAILMIVVFLKKPVAWAIGITIIASFVVAWIALTPRQRVAPWVLAVTLIVAFANSRALSDAGITFHSVLQNFAQTIRHQETPDSIVAIGSDDLHEKEFQAYFTQPVLKAATSSEEQTAQRLSELFSGPNTVFCLITESDYDKYLKGKYSGLEVVQEKPMFRRRIYLDGNFMEAVFDLDRKVIFPYFMENIVLVKKNSQNKEGAY